MEIAAPMISLVRSLMICKVRTWNALQTVTIVACGCPIDTGGCLALSKGFYPLSSQSNRKVRGECTKLADDEPIGRSQNESRTDGSRSRRPLRNLCDPCG